MPPALPPSCLPALLPLRAQPASVGDHMPHRHPPAANIRRTRARKARADERVLRTLILPSELPSGVVTSKEPNGSVLTYFIPGG